jgi:hypothetical protein
VRENAGDTIFHGAEHLGTIQHMTKKTEKEEMFKTKLSRMAKPKLESPLTQRTEKERAQNKEKVKEALSTTRTTRSVDV